MIFLGYLLSITYILGLLAVTRLLKRKTANVELGRKIVHIGTFFLLVVAHRCFVYKEHLVILSFLFTLLTLLSNKFNFFKGIEREDKSQFGTVYYSLALLTFSLVCVIENATRGNDTLSFSALAVSFTALALGDGTASLIGSKVRSPAVYKNKTLLGTFSCCGFTALGILLLNAFQIVEIGVGQAIALGLVAGVGELSGDKWDNLVVPFSVYLTYIGCVALGTTFTVAILLFGAVFYLGFLCKFLTLFGGIAAGFIGGSFYYFGGIFSFLFLIFAYAVMLVCTLVQRKKKCDLSSVVAKTKGKDFTEIFVNGFFATLALFLYGFTSNPRFLTISLLVLSANFADSLSSDIGTLSKKPPRDILKRKPVEKGISGGVTLLGLLSALCGAAVFGTISVFISYLPLPFLPLAILFAFSGTLTDSILGSCLQAKFQCSVCGKYTEKKAHCNALTNLVGGCKTIDNDAVNFLSSLVTFALCLSLLLL